MKPFSPIIVPGQVLSFIGFTQRDLDHIAKLMNDRPRKTLGWKTPAQALAEEIANGAKNGAIGA